MTGCPIDTEAMRRHAETTTNLLEGEMLIEYASSNALSHAREVLALCGALDAARAETERLRADLALVAEEGTDEARCHESDGHQFSQQCREIVNAAYFSAREALGEEKQR